MKHDNLNQFAEQMGEEHLINANECLFDISYGNEPQERWFKPIQASFKWAMFGRPIVAQRKDGFYAVLDGRHRIVAVRNLFGTDTTFKALVLTGLTQEDEAWMFSHLDIDRRSVPAAETFRSAVMAKERYAIDIEEVMTSERIEIIGVTGQLSAAANASEGRVQKTQAIGTLKVIYNREGKLGLRKTIQILKEAWIDEHGAFDRFPLVAVNAFLTKHRGAKIPTLIKALKDHNPGQLKTSSDGIKANVNISGVGNSVARFGLFILTQWYNGKTRGAGRLSTEL